jgi:hypothetical protein
MSGYSCTMTAQGSYRAKGSKMAGDELLEVTENDILSEVSAEGSDATVARVIRAVSAKRPPSVVREAYWQLISDNRLTRAANGHLARTANGHLDPVS